MATLEVRSLSRSYPEDVWALRDASFSVPDGRIAAILGPSGCGKTTLLRLVAGLDRPDDGDVFVGGDSIMHLPPHRRGIGLMFQDLALFPHMDVRENVGFGLRMHGWPKESMNARIREVLEVVGLSEKGRRKVHELSGGEQQRVALARALAPQPRVLLLDEPLGSLDEVLKQSLRYELRDVLKQLETTALIVSHDLRDAVAMADEFVVMEEGRVLQAGPLARVLSGPSSIRVAEMLGYVTLVQGSVGGGYISEPEVGRVAFPRGFPLEDGALALAHPSSLLGVPLDSHVGSGVSGVVKRIRAHGPMFLLDLEVGPRMVEVRWEWDLIPPALGTRVEVAVRPGTLRFFNAPAPPTPARRRVDGAGPPTDEEFKGEGEDEDEPVPMSAQTSEASEDRGEDDGRDGDGPGSAAGEPADGKSEAESGEAPASPPAKPPVPAYRAAGVAPETAALMATRHSGMPLD